MYFRSFGLKGWSITTGFAVSLDFTDANVTWFLITGTDGIDVTEFWTNVIDVTVFSITGAGTTDVDVVGSIEIGTNSFFFLNILVRFYKCLSAASFRLILSILKLNE